MIASWITAITTIVAGVCKVIKLFNGIIDKCESYDDLIRENTMYTLKLVILNEDLSLEERIHAGDRYIQLGGNGYIKKIYMRLLEEVK